MAVDQKARDAIRELGRLLRLVLRAIDPPSDGLQDATSLQQRQAIKAAIQAVRDLDNSDV